MLGPEIKIDRIDEVIEIMEGSAWPLKAGFLLIFDLVAAGREGQSKLLVGKAYRDVRPCLEQLQNAPKEVRQATIKGANHAALLIDKIAREYAEKVKAQDAAQDAAQVPEDNKPESNDEHGN